MPEKMIVKTEIPMTPLRFKILRSKLDEGKKSGLVMISHLISEVMKQYADLIDNYKQEIFDGEEPNQKTIDMLSHMSEIPYAQVEKLVFAESPFLMRVEPEIALELVSEFQHLAIRRNELIEIIDAAQLLKSARDIIKDDTEEDGE